MNRRIFLAIEIVLLTVITLTPAAAQRIAPRGPFVLNVDYARFRYDSTKAYVEIYFGFYPRLITFEQAGEQYAGKVTVYSRLRNDQTGQLHLNSVATLPVAVADTTEEAFAHTIVSEEGYAIPFGQYTLDVLAVDSLDQARRDSISMPLLLSALDNGPAASDLELCSSIKTSTTKNSPFYKNTLEVIPNPTLVFGVTNHPVIFSYLELYNLHPDQEFEVTTSVLTGQGETVKESTRKKSYSVANAVEATTMNVVSIESGKYRYVVVVRDSAQQEIVRSEKYFYLYNPHIKPKETNPAMLKSNELAGLSADELTLEFRQARYIAKDAEINTFSELSSEDAMRDFMAKFWSEVEAGKEGRYSITRAEYLHRVAAANQRYRAFNKPGWLTDRGRVSILYGEPDEVERYPSTEYGRPYEIWHYYHIENGVEFVFIDRSGFGEYTLVHSTKRGELRDDQWQRFLQ